MTGLGSCRFRGKVPPMPYMDAASVASDADPA